MGWCIRWGEWEWEWGVWWAERVGVQDRFGRLVGRVKELKGLSCVWGVGVGAVWWWWWCHVAE